MKKAKKLAVLGFDCALPHLLQRHIAEGYLPNFKRLFERGTFCDNTLVPYPTITPPNWTSIATGAWPATHQVTDYWLHTPGTDPVSANTTCAFGSAHNKAETLWEAAERAGKKSIVLNWPGAWPARSPNATVVGGAGLMVSQYQDGKVGLDRTIGLCGDQVISNQTYPYGIKGDFVDAAGWIGVDDPGQEPLELTARVRFIQAEEALRPETWYVLARDLRGQGYDTVTLSPTRNFADAYCTLSPGQWSGRIQRVFTLRDGREREGFFRVKLVELDPDADAMRLYITTINEVDGFTCPPELARKLYSPNGVPGLSAGFNALSNKWIDSETWVEVNWQQTEWLVDAAAYLLRNQDWDLFFMHSHPTDWCYHALMTELCPETASGPEKNAEAWELHRRIYETQDYLIGRMLDILDDDTLIVTISDHGATPDGPYINPVHILSEAGLLRIKDADAAFGAMGGSNAKLAGWVKSFAGSADVETSRALPQRVCHVYVNLKGRDPHGIVEPEEYEKVQQEIIDALMRYVHPETGERPFVLALTKKDARLLGQGGDQCGDVVYALKARYSSQHGAALPTGEYSLGSLKALMTFTGPGVRKNAHMERFCNIIDMAPTVASLMDLPVPEHCEGAVLYQLLEDE